MNLNQTERLEAVITWLQTLTVASTLVNCFLIGLVAFCVIEMRACRRQAGRDQG